MFNIGYAEMAVILVVAVLMFGKRLPEVARSVGQSYQQFRKGLSEIQNTITTDDYVNHESSDDSSNYIDEYEEELPETAQFVPPADD